MDMKQDVFNHLQVGCHYSSPSHCEIKVEPLEMQIGWFKALDDNTADKKYESYPKGPN